MDLGRVLALLVAAASGTFLWRFFSESWRGNVGWKTILAALLGASLASYERWPEGGYPCALAWAVLVLAPTVVGGRVSRAILEQRFQRAHRLSRLLRALHPLDGLGHQPVLVEALVLAQRGELDAAVARLETLARKPSLRPVATIQVLRLRNAWDELLAWAGSPEGRAVAESPGSAGAVLRALGETGQLERLVAEYARRRYSLETAAQSTSHALARLVLFAFTGDRATVERLLEGPLTALPGETRAFWIGTAELAAGEDARGRARLEAARGTPDAIARAAIERRLARPLAPAASLSPDARAYLARIRADWEQEERYAGPRVVGRGELRGTAAILAANLVVFLVEVLRHASESDEGLVRLGALVPSLALAGEPWRLLTAMFLHAGLVHLGMNMVGLWALGRTVEATLRTRRFLVVYFGAGLGSMAVCVLRWLVATRWDGALAEAWDDPLVGASGAIMGLVGAVGAIAWRGWRREGARSARQRFLWVLVVVALQSSLDLTIPEVSFTGHISGVLWGFAIALLLRHVGTERSR